MNTMHTWSPGGLPAPGMLRPAALAPGAGAGALVLGLGRALWRGLPAAPLAPPLLDLATVEDCDCRVLGFTKGIPLVTVAALFFVLGIVLGPCFEGVAVLRRTCRAAVAALDRWAAQQSQPLRPRLLPAA